MMKMKLNIRPTEKDALELLKKYSTSRDSLSHVLRHSKMVQKMALDVAEDVEEVDMQFIKVAALVHDIGRFSCPPHTPRSICHGVEGAKILRKEGWPKSYQNMCERHIGVGILKKDIIEQHLSLLKKDFVPKTKEEKILSYADNLEDNNTIRDEQYVVDRFRREVGEDLAKRVIRFHEEIKALRTRRKNNM